MPLAHARRDNELQVARQAHLFLDHVLHFQNGGAVRHIQHMTAVGRGLDEDLRHRAEISRRSADKQTRLVQNGCGGDEPIDSPPSCFSAVSESLPPPPLLLPLPLLLLPLPLPT